MCYVFNQPINLYITRQLLQTNNNQPLLLFILKYLPLIVPPEFKFSSIPNKHINYLVISFTSDWLFPTKENLQIVEILNRNTCKVSYTEIETDKGHDSFLLDEPELDRSIKGFLNINFDKILENSK